MTGPNPTLIKANPPAGSKGQPLTSETFVEVTHHVESGLDSSITESKTESIVDSSPITPFDPYETRVEPIRDSIYLSV